jgi:hypothetical protein
MENPFPGHGRVKEGGSATAPTAQRTDRLVKIRPNERARAGSMGGACGGAPQPPFCGQVASRCQPKLACRLSVSCRKKAVDLLREDIFLGVADMN